MKKMPCLFERDFSNRRRPVLLESVTPGCEWVLRGEGTPSRKRDGTACMAKGGLLYRRYDCRKGKAPPVGFIPCSAPDDVTGHWPGWIEVDDGPENRWHKEALTGLRSSDGSRFRERADLVDGTYELCGPKVNGNAEGLLEHDFIRHGSEVFEAFSRVLSDGTRFWDVICNFEGLREFLAANAVEGIVWHKPDEAVPMVKLRRDDYGLAWPVSR